jgi:hypothetical protein
MIGAFPVIGLAMSLLSLAQNAHAQSPTPATDEILVKVDEWDRTKAERDEAKAAAERLAKMAESFQRQAFECVNARAQEAAK